MRRSNGTINLPVEFIYPVVGQSVAVLAAFSFGDLHPAIGLLNPGWPAMSERSESNEASGTPVELATAFLHGFRGMAARMLQGMVFIDQPPYPTSSLFPLSFI